MTHSASATGIMAMTKWVTGWISGPIFSRVFDQNYPAFFAFVIFASTPPIVFAWFAPFPQTGHDHPGPGGPVGH